MRFGELDALGAVTLGDVKHVAKLDDGVAEPSPGRDAQDLERGRCVRGDRRRLDQAVGAAAAVGARRQLTADDGQVPAEARRKPLFDQRSIGGPIAGRL